MVVDYVTIPLKIEVKTVLESGNVWHLDDHSRIWIGPMRLS